MSKRRRAGRADQPRPLFRPSDRATAPRSETAPSALQPSLEPPGRLPRMGWIAALTVASTALVLYLRTLAPTVATGDSGELSTVAANLGLAHPPGYPTFTVLGHIFTWLPVGDAAYRVNLMSAVLDASAIAIAVVIAGRLIVEFELPTPFVLVKNAFHDTLTSGLRRGSVRTASLAAAV